MRKLSVNIIFLLALQNSHAGLTKESLNCFYLKLYQVFAADEKQDSPILKSLAESETEKNYDNLQNITKEEISDLFHLVIEDLQLVYSKSNDNGKKRMSDGLNNALDDLLKKI